MSAELLFLDQIGSWTPDNLSSCSLCFSCCLFILPTCFSLLVKSHEISSAPKVHLTNQLTPVFKIKKKKNHINFHNVVILFHCEGAALTIYIKCRRTIKNQKEKLVGGALDHMTPPDISLASSNEMN